MVHVLMIMEKFHSPGNITNNFWNLIGSWECAGYGTYEVAYIDPTEIWSQQGVDHVLTTKQYDAAFISVYHHLPSHHVARQVGHKTVMGWWDSVVSFGGVQAWSSMIHQLCFDQFKGETYPNIFGVEVPQDTRVFRRDDSVAEEFDVSFVGSMTSYWNDRRVLMDRIKTQFPNVWYNGGRGSDPNGNPLLNLPIEEYANIFRRSKICFNLTPGHGKLQRKGRTWEIAALGKFMMANNPQVLDGWLVDGEDYVSFDDNNVIDKVRYYLDHEDERKKIANNLYKKYNDSYSPKHFWKKVLNICGVQV